MEPNTTTTTGELNHGSDGGRSGDDTHASSQDNTDYSEADTDLEEEEDENWSDDDGLESSDTKSMAQNNKLSKKQVEKCNLFYDIRNTDYAYNAFKYSKKRISIDQYYNKLSKPLPVDVTSCVGKRGIHNMNFLNPSAIHSNDLIRKLLQQTLKTHPETNF